MPMKLLNLIKLFTTDLAMNKTIISELILLTRSNFCFCINIILSFNSIYSTLYYDITHV